MFWKWRRPPGSEFLLPVRGFFCLLCREFYGDAICAEEHVTTHSHNEKYKKQMYENPLYEQRRNLDRQAGLASDTSGKKRKHEDEKKDVADEEEKFKHKKEKKDKEKTREDESVQSEDKSKLKKEEEDDKMKMGKKADDEKFKYSKKEDKYRNNKEDEDRGKYNRRDEDDRYRYGRDDDQRYRYHRDEDTRYEDRPRYGPKHSDVRTKYERGRDEGKPKADNKEALRKSEPEKPAGKSEEVKPEPPPKPYDPPKVLCGPSPAMRAKLRKQNQELAKPAPVTTTPSFGKFTWKKKESVLAKEAQKIAAQFIKEDEAAVKDQAVSAEDSFAKSMAVAKEIAQKLSGQKTMPPPWASNGANRGRIRPNLPAPAAVLRSTPVVAKPAPLNTFLSMRPQNSHLQGPPPRVGPLLPEPPTKNLLLEAAPVPPSGPPEPVEAKPALLGANPAPTVFKPPPVMSVPPPPVMSVPPPPVMSVPPPSVVSTPTPPPPVVSKPPAPAGVKPLPSQAGPPASPKAPPAQSTVVKIVSDVAAPGVPESEQTRTLFVKPPPFMNKGDVAQKSEKLKSNLATAKAQDLFGIFYSSTGHSGPSSFTKPATDPKTDKTSTGKCSLPQVPEPQPVTTQVQPPAEDQSSLPAASHDSPPSPQTQTDSDIQIASVWSLQPTSSPRPEVSPPETTTPPDITQPVLSEALNQFTTEFGSQTAPQAKSAEPEFPTEPQSKLVPQIQPEPQPEPQLEQDTQVHPETCPDTVPEPEPKPSPKTRGKTPSKKSPPAARPPQQTRSQTRYQTRRQQQQQQQQEQEQEPPPQSESEPQPVSGDSEPQGLDTLEPDCGSQPEASAASEEDPPMSEITPETLGLPSDMTSLDFEYDFSFE